MNYFPTTIIDNFLPDPNWVRDFALSDKIEWHTDEKGMWPGERSQMLFEVDNNLFQFIMQRYLTHFYSPDDLDKVTFTARMQFQKINASYDKGWIHSDHPFISTFILYLTPDANPKSGTGLYSPKNLQSGIKHLAEKRKGFIAGEKVDQYRQAHNDQFFQNTFVSNVYNRLVSFDSSLWHGVEDFKNDEDRLTLVMFLQDLTGPATTIQRARALPFMRDVSGNAPGEWE
tara:strand:+ start:565 stop:1251 length:687 start_codon:yes stop_codon:yes gene_type:complete